MKQYIEQNKDRFLEELFSLIRIPSISSEQEHKPDMVHCAERWKELLLEAGADKAEAEVKADQIENIEKLVEKAYKPIIEDLTRQVKTLQEKVEKLEAEKDTQNEKIDELVAENRQLRRIVSEACPDAVIPNRRSENAKEQPRNQDGTFAKKEE